jgi:hypothetical protein
MNEKRIFQTFRSVKILCQPFYFDLWFCWQNCVYREILGFHGNKDSGHGLLNTDAV